MYATSAITSIATIRIEINIHLSNVPLSLDGDGGTFGNEAAQASQYGASIRFTVRHSGHSFPIGGIMRRSWRGGKAGAPNPLALFVSRRPAALKLWRTR
jgi:hypothetical protein